MKFILITALVFGGSFDFTTQTPMEGNNVRNATVKEFKFVVSIGRKDKFAISNPEVTHYCTGSMITRKHVLTAQHCFEDEQPNNTYVLYGSVDLKKAKRYDVKTWITYDTWLYENYNRLSFLPHDIALLMLQREIKDLNLNPVIPLTFPAPDLYGSYVIAAGWGRTENSSNSQILRVARFKIMSNGECSARMSEIADDENYLFSRFFCSRSEPWTLLDCGDSGGPLLRGNSLVGINLGSCPEDSKVTNLSRDLLDKKQINLHLGFHYYRKFILSVTTAS